MEFLGILLGILQGLFEWLPVSSEGQIVIILTQFFPTIDVNVAIALALFAHIGTALVVLFYYRNEFILMYNDLLALTRDIITRIKTHYWTPAEIIAEDQEQKNPWDSEGIKLAKIIFLTSIFTIPTALLSLLVFEELFEEMSKNIPFLSVGDSITILVGLFLIITGLVLKSRPSVDELTKISKYKFEHLSWHHAILLGLLQGFAAIPGISRSGITVTYLLLGSKLNQKQSLKGSFLISVPVTLGAGLLDLIRGKVVFLAGGIASNDGTIYLSYFGALLMITTAFIVGMLTLKIFLELAEKLPFDNFMLLFGTLAILFILLGSLIM
ncbi:MAG: undecaprenyl-diphosphate phosphatase [Candidatus Hodarchaeales archaeon]